MSNEPDSIRDWLRSLSDQELQDQMHMARKDEDDETEEMIYEEIGRRAAKRKL